MSVSLPQPRQLAVILFEAASVGGLSLTNPVC